MVNGSRIEADWKIKYEYRSNFTALPFLPSHIHLSTERNGKAIALGDFRLLSIKTSDQPLPESAYNLETYAVPNKSKMLYVSNQALIYKTPSGAWDTVKPPDERDFIKPKKKPWVLYAFIAGVVLITMIPIVFLTVRKGNKVG